MGIKISLDTLISLIPSRYEIFTKHLTDFIEHLISSINFNFPRYQRSGRLSSLMYVILGHCPDHRCTAALYIYQTPYTYPLLSKEQPNLSITSTLHWIECDIPYVVLFVAVNLSYDPMTIEKGLVLGFLVPQEIDISEISTETAQILKSANSDEGYDTGENEELNVTSRLEKSSFIISPADIEVHQKAKLKSAEVSAEHLAAFEQLCEKYKEIFCADSSDIAKAPLIKMDIDTGDSPLICQKPYNLPLKHAEWVKRELNILEKAGVIVCSVCSWASPILIVPKRSVLENP